MIILPVGEVKFFYAGEMKKGKGKEGLVDRHCLALERFIPLVLWVRKKKKKGGGGKGEKGV